MSETLSEGYRKFLEEDFSAKSKTYSKLVERARDFPEQLNIGKLSLSDAFNLAGEVRGMLEDLRFFPAHLEWFTWHCPELHSLYQGEPGEVKSFVSKLLRAESRLKQYIRRKTDKEPKLTLELIAGPNSHKFTDRSIDWLLGIGRRSTKEESDDMCRLLKEGSSEEFGGTLADYNAIREFVRAVEPGEGDVVYDLGCGYGRALFYGALSTSAQFKGVEIVPCMVENCLKVKERHGLKNVEFIEGNVNDADFSDGNVFFMFNPFSGETLERTGKRLRELAQTKLITLVSMGSNFYFNDEVKKGWLELTHSYREDEGQLNMRVYQSVTPKTVSFGGNREGFLPSLFRSVKRAKGFVRDLVDGS